MCVLPESQGDAVDEFRRRPCCDGNVVPGHHPGCGTGMPERQDLPWNPQVSPGTPADPSLFAVLHNGMEKRSCNESYCHEIGLKIKASNCACPRDGYEWQGSAKPGGDVCGRETSGRRLETPSVAHPFHVGVRGCSSHRLPNRKTSHPPGRPCSYLIIWWLFLHPIQRSQNLLNHLPI